MKEDKIFEKYPKLFAQRHLPITQSCMGWGLSHGEGWNGIIDNLCGEIQKHLEDLESKGYKVLNCNETPETPETPHIYQVEFTQIKSKFGMLRIYYDGGDESISDMVDRAEEKSAKTCEQCGDPANLERLGYWLETMCEPCKKKFVKKYRNDSSEK